jgi:hypothetical protein
MRGETSNDIASDITRERLITITSNTRKLKLLILPILVKKTKGEK